MMNAEMIKMADTAGGELLETEFIRVVFQKGFPAQVGINGCRVEDVIEVAMDRLREYQAGPLACPENEETLHHLNAAIASLRQRISRRQEQGVLNTMSPHDTRRTEDEDEDFSATGA